MWTRIALALQLVQLAGCFQVYQWQRDWGDDVLTRELAQVLPEVHQIVHSATDTSATGSVPAITLSIYSSDLVEFPNGMLAIRPLISEGSQICFIGHVTGDWSTDYSILHYRQGATIAADNLDAYDLDQDFPGGIDPLSIPSIADICGVDRSHVFFLKIATNVPSTRPVLNIQGPFAGYAVTVGEDVEQIVLVIFRRGFGAMIMTHKGEGMFILYEQGLPRTIISLSRPSEFIPKSNFIIRNVPCNSLFITLEYQQCFSNKISISPLQIYV